MSAAIEKLIRDVPDFPKPGITFKDITPLLADPAGLAECVKLMVEPFKGEKIECIAGIESRGFLFGVLVARELGIGFVPIRKPGKLPCKTIQATYELEYGTDTVEMHEDSVSPGQRVLLVDDLIATGGTIEASAKLVTSAGGVVIGCAAAIELAFLKARDRLGDLRIEAVLTY